MGSFALEAGHIQRTQGRLLTLAGLFLLFHAAALTLAPAARAHTWQVAFPWRHWLGFGIWIICFTILHRVAHQRLPHRDPYLVPIAALICGWGLLTIWRVTPEFGTRQTIWLVVATAIVLIGLRLPTNLRFLRDYKYLWLTGGLALTGLTLILGTNPAGGGPRLWLGCCGIYFQPSEPLKLLLVIYLAAYLADRQFLIPGLLPLLAPTLVMTGLTLLLLFVQRDLGTASIFLLLFTTVIYAATGKTRLVILSAITLVLAGVGGYLLFDVVRLRIDAWLNPWLDPGGRSYQIVQSLLAVASGGLPGRGPGLGSPTVVPVNHSDFIFASIAEEGGLVGGIGLITLVAMLTIRGLQAALFARDNYRRYLAVGLTAYLAIQTTLIVGGNLRLLPLTGVTLPFVSYGGSSLVTSFLALLFLLAISHQDEPAPAPLANPRPLIMLGGAFLSGLVAVSAILGWWAIVRGPDLVRRPDNPRRAINDRFVQRGALVDRHEEPLNLTTGTPGNLSRQYRYPDLGPVLGYNHPRYGQAGAEAGLDDFLRGLDGHPAIVVWWHHLAYGQPPPGLDVRLTLDLELQRQADALLEGQRGALVLLNARSGELLALASHPTFDANVLDDTWETILQDPGAPLLNRATLGQYPVDTALTPLLLTAAMQAGPLPKLPRDGPNADSLLQGCARPPGEANWGALVSAGCPALVPLLSQQIGPTGLLNLFASLGFYASPALRVDTVSPNSVPPQGELDSTALGADLRLSPLHMALAAGALNNAGQMPAPQLASAIRTPSGTWQVLPPLGKPTTPFEPQAALRALATLSPEETLLWGAMAVSTSGDGQAISWFLGGTTADWQGTPLAIAVVLETNQPLRAAQIGQILLQAAMRPLG